VVWGRGVQSLPLPDSGSFYAANVKLVEDTAKRVTSQDILSELGGSICVNGRVIEGEEAVEYIDQMDQGDRLTMIEDMLSVGYFPQSAEDTQHREASASRC